MPEYIEREALIAWLESPTGFRANCEDCAATDCIDCIIGEAIKNAPTADVVPVRHGRWIPTLVRGSMTLCCSECGADSGSICGSDFCPTCMAQMDMES